MGVIHLEGMEFYAYHGCFDEERIAGSKFIVNLLIETNMDIPAKTDDINDALNYQSAYFIVKKEMEVKSYLLEHIAERILDKLYLNFHTIIKATVKVSKMNPPMGGKLKSVSVSLSR